MRNFKRFFSFLLLLCITHQVTPQGKGSMPPVRTCGTPELPADFESWIQPIITSGFTPRVVYTLPVVVHVIHNGETVGSGSNLSTAQIQSQIDILNEDFRMLNADITSVPAPWTSVAADCEINFCLAQTDPSGNPMPEPGINRINRSTMGFSAPPYSDTYTDATIKPATIWDPNQYLNIWVLSLGSGLLGYATFPPSSGLSGLSPPYGTATSDGVVILNTAFGNTGTAAAPYNLGRTATHEIGHWLGLRHVWGDAFCGNDFCADTPTQQDANVGCPSWPSVTCSNGPNGDMFMNYMDYVNDACMYMFSSDQAARIQTCMANSPMRVALASSTKCNPGFALDAGITDIVNPTGNSCVSTINPVVTLQNFGTTTLTSVTIHYQLDGGTVSTYTWTGSLTTGSSTNVVLPAMAVGTGAHTYTAYTSGPNGGTDGYSANDSSTGSFTIVVSSSGAALPFAEGFQSTTFVPTGWTLENPDANTTWARTTAAGGFGASTASARFDNYSPATSIAGQSDYMITPGIDLATGPGTIEMTFDVAYARYDATYFDSLIVSISTDCGGTWTRLYANGGSTLATAPDNDASAFTPTAAQWRTDNIDLTPYLGTDPVQFRFENKSGWGQRLYIDNINITHTPGGPTAGFTGSPTTVCAGQTVTFTNTTTGGATSYSWSFAGGTPASSTATNPTVTYNTPGTYTVSLTATNGSGSNTLTNTNYITVTALPTATATNSGPVCAGGSFTLNTPAVAGATYSWTGPGGYTSTVRNPTITGATTAMAGVYTVTVTAGGCSNTSSTTLVVNPAPAASASNTGPYCVGQTISLSTPTVSGATYAWTGPVGYTSAVQNPTRPGATTPMAGTYTVTVTAGGCSATSSTTVTVSALPSATATNTGPVCEGASFTVSTPAVTGCTYSWSGPAGFTSTLRNPTIAGATTAMTGVYTVTVTRTSTGCSNTSGTTVTVNPAPAASASNTGPYCVGQTISLSTTTVSGASYAWTGPGGYTSGVQNPTRTGSTTAMSGTYSVTVTVGGCSATSSTTVTVNALPSATATNTGPVCEGQSFSVSTPAVTGCTYSWSGPAGFTSTLRNPAITGATTAMAGVYTVTVTRTSTGCTNTSGTTVIINPGPVSNATNTGPVCEGASFDLNTPTVAGATYAWTGPGGFTSTDQNPAVGPATTGSSGTYTVTVTLGSCATSSATTATVTPLPAASAANDGPVCEGSALSLSTSTVSGATYAWTGPGGFTSSVQNPGITSATISGIYTVTVTAAGCTNTSSTSVTVHPLPNAAAINDGPVCEGGTINLGTPAVTGGGYAWSGPGGFTSPAQNPVLNPAVLSAAGTYTVTVTDGNGCVNTSSTTVTVNPVPVAMAGTDVSVCPGETVTLNASGGGTYSWSPSGSLSDPSVANPVATLSATTTYVVTVSNGMCTDADSVTVSVHPAPPVPTISRIYDTLFVSPSSGGYTYQWYLNGSPISGANGPSYIVTANGDYSVEITDVNGCTSLSSSYLYTYAAIAADPRENGFGLYPNPNNGTFSITFGQTAGTDLRLMIYDGTGRIVYDAQVAAGPNRSAEISAGELARGTYTVVLTSGNSRYFGKLVINY